LKDLDPTIQSHTETRNVLRPREMCVLQRSKTDILLYSKFDA